MHWDLIQHFQINEAKSDARDALHTANSQDNKRRYLQNQVDRLSLACQAMWEILRDHTGLTEEQLLGKMKEIDARDGKMDGKMTNEVLTCPSCNNKTGTQTGSCIYCGLKIQAKHTFKT